MRRIAWAVVLAACGGGGGGGSVAIGDLPTYEQERLCELAVNCGVFEDKSICEAQLALGRTTFQNEVAAVNDGLVHYDGAKAKACIDAVIETSSCDRGALFDDRNQIAACIEAITGTVAAGGPCAINAECISQSCTGASTSPTCQVGTCDVGSAPVAAHAGEACTKKSAVSNCIDSYCDMTSGHCAPYKLEGTACQGSGQCAPGTTCAGTTAPTCTVLAATGSACMTSSDCADLGTTCSGGTCVMLAKTGAACTMSSDCVGGDTCDATKHCVHGPRTGDACSTTSRCTDGSFCDQMSSVCTALKADGAACQSSSECAHTCDFTAMMCITPPTCE